MTTELQKVESALTEFQKIEAGLAALREQYDNVVYPVTTPAGMKEAVAARRAIREPRVATEKVRKEAKEPILALGRQLDAKAKYIHEELMKLEGPIDAQIKIEEGRKEKEIHDENMRVIGIKERINDLGLLVPKMAGRTAAEITGQISSLQDHDLTEWAMEFIVDAEKAREQTVQALQRLHAGALAQEEAAAKEAAKLAAERAELEVLRAAAAEREKAEKARMAAEQAERDAANKAARAEIERAEAESRARMAEEERITREAREAEEAAIRAKRQAVEKEEAKLRAEQVALADARSMLKLFVQRYRNVAEFKALVTWIDKYFTAKVPA